MFARSAFNRYYYGAFLLVRDMLSQMDPGWARNAHKSYPELLKGAISKDLKTAMKRANRVGDYDLAKKINVGLWGASALAKLMEKAYAARVTADYESAIPVKFSNSSRFSLNSIDITDAHGWDEQVRAFTHSILDAWKQSNA